MSLSTAERRFLREWEIQRSGSKLGFYVLYILMWTLICMLCLFFIMNYFDLIKSNWPTLIIMITISLTVAYINTNVNWKKNEKKFKALINREINL